nr:citrate synthase, glyoxysomal [Ipomoea batatas]
MTIIDERTGQRYQVQVSEEDTVKAADLKKVGGSVRGRSSSITETPITFAGDFSGRQSHCHPERSMPNPFKLASFPVYLNRRPNYSSSPNSRKPYASNSSPRLAAADSSQSNASASLFTFSLVVRSLRPPNPSPEKWLQPPATTAAVLCFHASKTLWVVSDKYKKSMKV